MVRRVSEEIRVYTEDDIIKSCDDKIKDLYSEVKFAVLGLGPDVTIHLTKTYIAFHRKQAFTGFHPSKTKLGLDFRVKISELEDPKRIARGVRHGNWSTITITESREISYALSLIWQAYERSNPFLSVIPDQTD
jgi:predicted transport protein